MGKNGSCETDCEATFILRARVNIVAYIQAAAADEWKFISFNYTTKLEETHIFCTLDMS